MSNSTPSYTIDPTLRQRAANAVAEDSGQLVQLNNASEGGAKLTLHATGILQPTGPRPLAWVELNGYVNPVGRNDIIKPGRKYIYNRDALQDALSKQAQPDPIIFVNSTAHQAAVATGVAPRVAPAPAPPFSRADMLSQFNATH
jgi:hypothetical protein